GVGGKARVGGDLIVVPHTQAPVAEALRVVIAGEGEVMLRLEPAVVRAAEGVEWSLLDHGSVLPYITQNLRVEAAVDIQRRSGDIGSRRACQKRNGRSHLLGLAVAAERRGRFLQAGKVTVTRRVHVGINGTRLDIIDGDALGTQITSPAAGIGGDGALCGRIVGSAWPRRGVAHDRADRDD